MESLSKAEFIERYGSVMVRFHSYYKYSFTFKAALDDGAELRVEVGGISDDIYRMEVVADYPEAVKDLDPNSGSVYVGSDQVVSFYEPY